MTDAEIEFAVAECLEDARHSPDLYAAASLAWFRLKNRHKWPEEAVANVLQRVLREIFAMQTMRQRTPD
jgi:hypothetical protein